jgi:hypothetical protein
VGDQQFRYQTQEELQQKWQFVYQPLLMDREVDELPSEDDWELLILPDTDAINRDPGAEEEQTPQTAEESYELDKAFPER